MAAMPVHAIDVGDAAPPFELETLDGRKVNYNEIKGKKPMLLVFWATWCPACKEEIPRLKSVYSDFKSKGLSFLAINVGINDSVKKAEKYVEKHGIDYPVAYDEGSSVTRIYRVHGTPTVMVLDKNGIVRYRSSSAPQDLSKHFDALLAD